MLKDLEKLALFIGNTPLMELNFEPAALFAKLEYNNFSGSAKDRAAYSIIYDAIVSGKIDQDTTIVASSSGNLAIAVAFICKKLKLKFIPVIDPNINKGYEDLLRLVAYKVVKVVDRDKTGGFLLTRIETVNRLCATIKNSFCADQYCDINNYKGYYGLGNEIVNSFDTLDYIFIAVSSCGAITGISRFIKERMPNVKIVAVDIEGSVIFGRPPKRRFISGIGSSQASPLITDASIDDVVFVSQTDVIDGCHELLEEQVIFAGASSGAVYLAAKEYFKRLSPRHRPVTLLIFPDKGLAYLDTIYNNEWKENLVISLLETV